MTFTRESAGVLTPSAPKPHTQPYKPGIDGLRALAILPVILFHLGTSFPRGGFVGVDIFFVISGYLITGLLLRECEQGTFSLRRFYQRRIARLFPSIALLFAVTFPICFFLMDQHFVGDNGLHMAESVLSVVNLFSVKEGSGYFGVARDAHPYLHFWSLAVEEQFYIFFPVTLIVLWRYARRRITICLIALLVISFIFCVHKTAVNQTWAYFMLPTRAWELLTGSVVAALQLKGRINNNQKHSVTAWLGLGSVLLSILAIREAHFPGAIAIIPVAGAAALIIGCTTAENAVNRFLSNRVLVKTGQLSYVLYLWHLPIFCFIDYHYFLAPAWFRICAKLFLTAIATFLASYIVEIPARRYFNRTENQRQAFLFAGAVVVIAVAVGVFVRIYVWPEAKGSILKYGGLGWNTGAHGPSVAIMGDSVACASASTVRDIAVRHDMRFHSLCVSNTAPVFDGPPAEWQSTLAGVKRLHPDVLVVQLAWMYRIKNEASLSQTLDALAPYVGKFILVTQYPELPMSATRDGMRAGSRPPYFEPSDVKEQREDGNRKMWAVARAKRITVLDTVPYFTHPNGSIKVLDGGNHLLYFDSVHASTLGVSSYAGALEHSILQSLPAEGRK